MAKGRENKKIINVGTFTRGMVPDVIGAADSMVDILDGWIDRGGEIRKRGGRPEMYSTAENGVIRTASVFSDGSIASPVAAMFISNSGDAWHKVRAGVTPSSSTVTPAAPNPANDSTTYGRNVISVDLSGNRVWESSTNVVRALTAPSWDADAANAVTCTTHGERLFVGNTDEDDGGSRIRWSGTPVDAIGPATGFDVWYEAAYIDVFPGIGGDITSLESINGNLVIFKHNAVFVMRGDVATKGFDLGARIDKLVDTSGAASPAHTSIYSGGAIWMNSDGIWQFGSEAVRNLTDGRVKSSWRDFIPNLELGTVGYINGVADRIIVLNSVIEDNGAFVYDSEKDLFYRESASDSTHVLSLGTTEPGNKYNGGMAFVDWSGGMTSDLENDFGETTVPRLEILTQPLSPNYPFYTDRPNKLLVSGYISDDDGTEPYMEASILHGRNDLYTSGDAEQMLEYGFRKRGYDNTERISIPGVPARPANRFRLKQINSAQDIRIYGIGAEYLGDFTTDPQNDTGATSYGS